MEHILYSSPIGVMKLCAEKDKLIRIDFMPSDILHEEKETHNATLRYAVSWLRRYFSGEELTIPVTLIELRGTDFQLRVWQELIRIPYGQTVTYGELAQKESIRGSKGKMSAQAVGQAVHMNPLPIIVPCHRVTGKGNALTGYGGGIERKIFLLENEHIAYKK